MTTHLRLCPAAPRPHPRRAEVAATTLVVALVLATTAPASPPAAPKQPPAPTDAPPPSPPTPSDGRDAAASWRGALPAVKPCGADVPGMACIPAGPMVRGRDDGPANERPAMRLWLQTFYLDRLEVTYADYQACARRRQCRPVRPIYSDFNRPKQPMVAVTWFDAKRYCEAVGKQLPTEAQWEKAARGEAGELYPWGDAPVTCERAVIEDLRGRSCGVAKRGKAHLAHVGRTFEVPARPAFRYGLHDIIGNSWEWVADWHSDYARCGAACAGVDPLGPCGGALRCPGHRERVLRGGSWYWNADHATGTYRRPYVPENQPISHFGFRCAASVEQAAALRVKR